MGQPLREPPITWKAKHEAQWAPDVPSDAEYIPRNAGGFHRQSRDVFYPLRARIKSLVQLLLVELIDDLTVSQDGAPEWVLIEDVEFERYCRATRNGVHEALDFVMKPEREWIERWRFAGDARKWEYRVHRQNFSRGEPRPMRKCSPRKQAVRANHAVAAYSGGSPGEPGESRNLPTPVGILSQPGALVEMPTPVGVLPQSGCPISELQCANGCERPLLLKKIEELEQASNACSNKAAGDVVEAPAPIAGSKEIELLHRWISKKAWGHGYGFNTEELRDILRALQERRLGLIEFLTHNWDVSIQPDRQNIVGLMIYLMDRTPRRSYSASNRAPDRLTPAAEIKLNPGDPPKCSDGGI